MKGRERLPDLRTFTGAMKGKHLSKGGDQSSVWEHAVVKVREHRRGVELTLIFLLYSLLAFLSFPTFGEWGGETDFVPYIFSSAARETILQYHQIPLWNPYTLGGISQVSAPLAGQFQPFFLLHLLFDFYRGVLVEYAFLCGLCGLGLYLLTRLLGASRTAAVLPGVAFVASNIMPVYLVNGWFNYMGISLVPLGLWAYTRILNLEFPGSVRLEALLAVISAQMVLMADNYHVVFMGSLLLIILLCKVLTLRSWHPVKSLIRVALVAGLIAGLRLVPILAGGEGLGEKITSGLSPGYSFTLRGLIHALTAWNSSADHLWESVGYTGSVIVALSIPGFVRAWRNAWPFLICLLFFIVFSLGSNLSPHSLFAQGENLAPGPEAFSLVGLMQIIPGLGTLHNPSRALPVVALLLTVFASFGIDAIFTGAEKITRRLKAGGIRRIICLAVCCIVGIPGLMETHTYFTERMHELNRPEFDRFPTFRQVRGMPGYNSLFPGLNCGILDPRIPYYRPSRALRAVGDRGYYGEERWIGDGSVELVEWTPNRLVYRVSGEGEGRLVINQNFAPDWRISKNDSMNIESYRALLSVTARAPCEITLRYQPAGFIAGLILSCIGILTLSLMLRGPDKGGFSYRRRGGE